MARYFFDFANYHEGAWLPDPEGIDLSDLRAAHEHAIRLVYQTLPYVADGPDWRGWTIEILDEQRVPALTVLFPVPSRKVFGLRRGPAGDGETTGAR